MEDQTLLEVSGLSVSYFGPEGEVRAVRELSYALRGGEILGIVGESGAGKSTQAHALLKLLPGSAKWMAGSVLFAGESVRSFDKGRLRRYRGGEAAIIFQEPGASLNPVRTLGSQLTEALRAHDRPMTRTEAAEKSVEMLRRAGIPDAERRFFQYPHELSGGLLQRSMIAMSLLSSPRLLIADEPTAALDATVQAGILDLLARTRAEEGLSILLITHHLNVVAELCDRVCVMYAGQIVEQGRVEELFHAPAHPYTQGLLRSCLWKKAESLQGLAPIPGTPADPLCLPAGCAFAPRCPGCMRICLRLQPGDTELGQGHRAACWLLSRDRINIIRPERKEADGNA